MNTWNGYEDRDLVKLTAGSHQLFVTQDHPINTQDGIVKAGHLRTGDFVVCEDDLKQVTIEFVRSDCTVYNIEFDIPTLILAEGFEVGDMGMQNREE